MVGLGGVVSTSSLWMVTATRWGCPTMALAVGGLTVRPVISTHSTSSPSMSLSFTIVTGTVTSSTPDANVTVDGKL